MLRVVVVVVAAAAFPLPQSNDGGGGNSVLVRGGGICGRVIRRKRHRSGEDSLGTDSTLNFNSDDRYRPIFKFTDLEIRQ
ncbi:hypothetical protein B0T19DRAFT_426985 [Cercophora scortea]|uniref:Secreted protein n=1 Tax=Cercophora scortea TaxID=314031 RepID=A0AAE0IGF2_9PEZI|nr:hypothetical protein B0T19DRAFT_426985 [Cercophora scortea]